MLKEKFDSYLMFYGKDKKYTDNSKKELLKMVNDVEQALGLARATMVLISALNKIENKSC